MDKIRHAANILKDLDYSGPQEGFDIALLIIKKDPITHEVEYFHEKYGKQFSLPQLIKFFHMNQSTSKELTRKPHFNTPIIPQNIVVTQEKRNQRGNEMVRNLETREDLRKSQISSIKSPNPADKSGSKTRQTPQISNEASMTKDILINQPQLKQNEVRKIVKTADKMCKEKGNPGLLTHCGISCKSEIIGGATVWTCRNQTCDVTIAVQVDGVLKDPITYKTLSNYQQTNLSNPVLKRVSNISGDQTSQKRKREISPANIRSTRSKSNSFDPENQPVKKKAKTKPPSNLAQAKICGDFIATSDPKSNPISLNSLSDLTKEFMRNRKGHKYSFILPISTFQKEKQNREIASTSHKSSDLATVQKTLSPRRLRKLLPKPAQATQNNAPSLFENLAVNNSDSTMEIGEANKIQESDVKLENEEFEINDNEEISEMDTNIENGRTKSRSNAQSPIDFEKCWQFAFELAQNFCCGTKLRVGWNIDGKCFIVTCPKCSNKIASASWQKAKLLREYFPEIFTGAAKRYLESNPVTQEHQLNYKAWRKAFGNNSHPECCNQIKFITIMDKKITAKCKKCTRFTAAVDENAVKGLEKFYPKMFEKSYHSKILKKYMDLKSYNTKINVDEMFNKVEEIVESNPEPQNIPEEISTVVNSEFDESNLDPLAEFLNQSSVPVSKFRVPCEIWKNEVGFPQSCDETNCNGHNILLRKKAINGFLYDVCCFECSNISCTVKLPNKSKILTIYKDIVTDIDAVESSKIKQKQQQNAPLSTVSNPGPSPKIYSHLFPPRIISTGPKFGPNLNIGPPIVIAEERKVELPGNIRPVVPGRLPPSIVSIVRRPVPITNESTVTPKIVTRYKDPKFKVAIVNSSANCDLIKRNCELERQQNEFQPFRIKFDAKRIRSNKTPRFIKLIPSAGLNEPQPTISDEIEGNNEIIEDVTFVGIQKTQMNNHISQKTSEVESQSKSSNSHESQSTNEILKETSIIEDSFPVKVTESTNRPVIFDPVPNFVPDSREIEPPTCCENHQQVQMIKQINNFKDGYQFICPLCQSVRLRRKVV